MTDETQAFIAFFSTSGIWNEAIASRVWKAACAWQRAQADSQAPVGSEWRRGYESGVKDARESGALLHADDLKAARDSVIEECMAACYRFRIPFPSDRDDMLRNIANEDCWGAIRALKVNA